MELKPKDLKLIETKKGLVGLLQSDHGKLNFAKALRTVKYENRICLLYTSDAADE